MQCLFCPTIHAMCYPRPCGTHSSSVSCDYFPPSLQSQDPKEYVSFLNRLRRMDENYRKYTIDKLLGNFSSALCHIVLAGMTVPSTSCVHTIYTMTVPSASCVHAIYAMTVPSTFCVHAIYGITLPSTYCFHIVCSLTALYLFCSHSLIYRKICFHALCIGLGIAVGVSLAMSIPLWLCLLLVI